MAVAYNKLVRDRIPEIISSQGRVPVTHEADELEYCRFLRLKLVEEAEEFAETGAVEELADILEVVHALCRLDGHRLEDVEKARVLKHEERGGFAAKIILDEVREV